MTTGTIPMLSRASTLRDIATEVDRFASHRPGALREVVIAGEDPDAVSYLKKHLEALGHADVEVGFRQAAGVVRLLRVELA